MSGRAGTGRAAGVLSLRPRPAQTRPGHPLTLSARHAGPARGPWDAARAGEPLFVAITACHLADREPVDLKLFFALFHKRCMQDLQRVFYFLCVLHVFTFAEIYVCNAGHTFLSRHCSAETKLYLCYV